MPVIVRIQGALLPPELARAGCCNLRKIDIEVPEAVRDGAEVEI